MYPLSEDYENQVLNFLRFLNSKEEIKVITNGVSTQIFGEFNSCMSAVQEGIESVFNGDTKAVFNMKVLKGNLDGFDKELL